MKTLILKKLGLLGFLLFSVGAFAQNYNHAYGTIDVWNAAGQNPHDFIFSYDVINGVHTCSNNFAVVSNLSVASSFNFRILINGIDVYTGAVTLPAYGRVFFDNAFMNCNSLLSRIQIVVL